MSLLARHTLAPMLGFLAASNVAHASPQRAAVKVLTFEVQQKASRLLSESDLELSARVLKGQARVPHATLLQTWPYDLSQRYFAAFRGTVEPPMGELFFPAEIADLKRKGDLAFLRQLNRYLERGVPLADPADLVLAFDEMEEL